MESKNEISLPIDDDECDEELEKPDFWKKNNFLRKFTIKGTDAEHFSQRMSQCHFIKDYCGSNSF